MLRVLFFNEGNLGTRIMGQGQLEASLRVGLEREPGVSARFAGPPPMGRWARALATRPVPLLGPAGMDLRPLRWHVVESLRSRRALGAQLAADRPDVLHVHTQSVAMLLGSVMRSLPTVLSVDTTVADWDAMPAWHRPGPQAPLQIGPSRVLERRALEHAALVLAWTGWTRRSIEREAPRAHAIELHPGIDLARYRPAPRRERALPRVLFVGGRFREKGGEELLEVLGPDLARSVELDLVTPEPVAERPGVRVHRLGPADPALLDLHQQADLFCLPSHGDAAPWAVLEAMACGTPVLATGVGGIPDMLDGGRCGLTVAVGDRRGLRAGLDRLLAAADLRRELGTRARERCEHAYDARVQTAAMVRALAEIGPPQALSVR